MDFVKHNTEILADLFEGSKAGDDRSRTKTSLRMQYEAQGEVIQKQIGDLEEIRRKMALSRRKICQLLLVDPSAWTRWLKEGRTPPHILRALQWYLIIQEKIPGLTPQYFIGKDPSVLHQEALRKIGEESRIRAQFVENFSSLSLKYEQEVQDLQSMNLNLKNEIAQLKETQKFLKILLFGGLFAGIGIFLTFWGAL